MLGLEYSAGELMKSLSESRVAGLLDGLLNAVPGAIFALALGWGPIVDVGVVARDERLQAGLRRLTGVAGMRAREALDFMAQALEQPADAAALAVLTISPTSGALGGGRLAVLRSPTYAALMIQGERLGDDGGRIDLYALAVSEGFDAVRSTAAGVIVRQLARVLHAREEDISRVRPLGEIGLDSLMALELAMNLEQAFGVHLPMSGSSGAKTVADIADEITAHIGAEHGRDEAVIATLADRHHEHVKASQAEILKQMINETPKAKRLLS
jgi:acyl carrier protein